MQLKTDYANSIYDGNRKYKVTDNGDGTLSIEDKTVYSVDGDYYGAGDINKQNMQYNTLNVDYQIVGQLINKLRSYGITVSGDSPADIINAINTLATQKYNGARTNGQNTVKNNANAYGFYTTGQYQAQQNVRNGYDARIRSAISSLNDIINTASPYSSQANAAANTVINTVNANVVANMSSNATKAAKNAVKTQNANWYNNVTMVWRNRFQSDYGNAANQANV